MLKSLHRNFVRLLLATAVLVILIGLPTAPPVFASGECPTVTSGSCG